MNLRQILLTICLTASLGLTGCSLAAPARVPTAPTLAATATTISPTVMPLPTLPQGRQPRAIETPVTINITTTREPVRAERIVLVFQWRGGIAGRNDMWTIYQNGLVSSNKGTDQHIDPQIVQTLLTQLESLGYYS